MLRVKNIKVNLDENLEDKIIKKLRIKEIINYKINKQSLDARDKQNIHYVYEVDINLENEQKFLNYKDIIKTPKEVYVFPIKGKEKINYRKNLYNSV